MVGADSLKTQSALEVYAVLYLFGKKSESIYKIYLMKKYTIFLKKYARTFNRRVRIFFSIF